MERSRAWYRRLLLAGGVAVTTTAVLFVAVPPAAATPAISGTVQDGFENPVVTPGTFDAFVAGEQMGAWTVTSGDVDLTGAGFWETAEGVQSLDLNGVQPGAVALDLDTIPLLSYRVSYALAGNPSAGPAIKTGQVRINGNVVQNISFDITGRTRADMGYIRKSFLFLATSHVSTLEFRSTTSPGGFGPVIDDVRVQTCLLIICLG